MHGAPVETCGFAVNASLHYLRTLSGAILPSGAAKEKSFQCRRAGYRYFVASLNSLGNLLIGLCLPIECLYADATLLVQAVRPLLGHHREAVRVEAFTDLHLTETESATIQTKRSVVQKSEKLATAWFPTTLQNVCSGGMPTEYYAAPFLAFVLHDFRGNSVEYIHAIFTGITCFLGTKSALNAGEADTTFLVAGNHHYNYKISGGTRIRIVMGVKPCGAENWLTVHPEAKLGVEMFLSPMWQLSVPPPDEVTRFWALYYGRLSWNGINDLQMCEQNLNSSLRWAVPQDALPSAYSLAVRDGCAAAATAHLPELVAQSVFYMGRTSIVWSEVERKALHCLERFEASYWEVHVKVADWLPLTSFDHARDVQQLRQLGGHASKDFFAFVCLPSRFAAIEKGLRDIGGVPAHPRCTEEHVVKALPVLFAHHTGLYEECAQARAPIRFQVKGGGRTLQMYSPQLIEYHAGAAEEWSRGRQDDGEELVSVAACVLGLPRTLSSPEVYLSIAQNATGRAGLGVDASVFFVLDIGSRPLADFAEAFRHVPPAGLALVDDASWGAPKQCPEFMRCGPACVLQFHKLGVCLRLIEAAEKARSRPFDWLIRLRPDTAWRAPIGHVTHYDSSSVHVVFRENGRIDMNDHFALVPRKHGDAYFGIGESCPSAQDVMASTCGGDLSGGTAHTYPECAIKMHLEKLRVPLVPFPQIFELVRDAGCVQSHTLWQGVTKTEKCGTTGN